MLKYNKITLWKGRKVEDLSREELLEIIEYLGRIHQEFFLPRNIKARALGKVELIKNEK